MAEEPVYELRVRDALVRTEGDVGTCLFLASAHHGRLEVLISNIRVNEASCWMT
jgi:hypothetical protein